MLAQTSRVDGEREAAAHARLLARLARWAEKRPHASLAFCLGLFGTQLMGSVLLFLVVYGTDAPWIPPVEFAMKGVLLLLPLGSLVGIYLATRAQPADQGRLLHVVGILANGAYLVYGLYLWSIVLGDFLASGP
jgi:hypothetical protein